MKTICRVGVAVIAALALLALAAGSAFAANGEFLVGGNPANNVAVKSHSSGKIKLQDDGAKSGVECEATDKGTVGTGGNAKADSTTAVTFSNCTAIEGCAAEADIEVSALHLPWNTTLAATLKDTISSSGAGAPGYAVKCLVLGILITDECTKETAQVEITNNATSINALFNTEEKAKCSVGGAETGLVHGTEVIETESGAALQAS